METKTIKYLLLLTVFFLSGCTLKLTIHQPANGVVFSAASTVNLEAEVRGGEQGCGGEDCNCADWWWTKDGVALGLNKSNGHLVSYCRYSWTLPASTLGFCFMVTSQAGIGRRRRASRSPCSRRG